jgi:hypothetical protein
MTVSLDPGIELTTVESYMQEVAKMTLAAEPYDVERLNRALFAYSSLGREKAINMMRHSRAADFNPINVSTSNDKSDGSSPTLMSLRSRASSSVKEVLIRTRRVDNSKNAPLWSYDTRTFGRTSN